MIIIKDRYGASLLVYIVPIMISLCNVNSEAKIKFIFFYLDDEEFAIERRRFNSGKINYFFVKKTDISVNKTGQIRQV